MISNVLPPGRASIIHGPLLSDEPGLGALTLPGYLREVSERHASNEALVFHHADGVERWTYAKLWEQALAVARALVACGVGKDSRVGVMMTNRPEWLAAFFGVGLAGGVAAAISTFSTPAELAVLLNASSVSILLFEGQVLKRDFAAMLEEMEPRIANAAPGELTSPQFPFLRRLVMVGPCARRGLESWRDFLVRGEAVDPAIVMARADLAAPADVGALFFSSGSTGKPKGVISTHRAVAVQAWRWRRMNGFENDVRCWTANGFFWSGTFCMSLGATLSAGGSLVLQSAFDPNRAIELMESERVTFAYAQPHQWAQLRDAPRWRTADLSAFRYVNPMFVEDQPTVATDWEGPPSYGNTENFTIVASYPSGTPVAITGASHGVPLPGTSIKIVDPVTGATLPMGERGEIAVKGPTLMLGYLGVPLNETFDADGFLNTGDGGFIDECGRLVFEGRINDIIKTGGANVSPVEVDTVLETCPGVRISRTVGVPHETLGELVVSCIVPHAGANLDEDMVRAYAKLRLASYKAPRRVIFVDEDELELTGSAKVKTRELREIAIRRLSPDGGGGTQ